MLPLSYFHFRMCANKIARLSTLSKCYPDFPAAIHDVKDGTKIIIGGNGVYGVPKNLISAVSNKSPTNLTVVTCGVGEDVGSLLSLGRVSMIKTSYCYGNSTFAELFRNGKLRVHFIPQGTLVEKLRCGGAGIPAFFTSTGVGTAVEFGQIPQRALPQHTPAPQYIQPTVEYSAPKETRHIQGKECLYEESITGNFALIKAWRGDPQGNLQFSGVDCNFNPECAKAAKVTIAEVEQLIGIGEFKPEEIDLPGIYVHRIVQVQSQTHAQHTDTFEGRTERRAGEQNATNQRIIPVAPLRSSVLRKWRERMPILQQRRSTVHWKYANKIVKISNPVLRYAMRRFTTVPPLLIKQRIARRAALEIEPGICVNLGIGKFSVIP